MPARIIKRYANRKLYDTERSCYVTLEEIAAMVKEGEDVRILDNKSGDDLSGVTLAQIVFEEEKRQSSSVPLSTLRGIIQSSGEFLERHIGKPVQDILGRAEDGTEAPAATADGPVPAGDSQGPGIASFVRRSQDAIEDIQKDIDDRIHKVLNTMTQLPTLQKEVVRLRKRIVELEDRIAELEGG